MDFQCFGRNDKVMFIYTYINCPEARLKKTICKYDTQDDQKMTYLETGSVLNYNQQCSHKLKKY
uniref:Uncharacterized protein n=1 Tax=Anguilla anguilla TaxID=7936 RepID=A0A0E9WVI6_ANGAN